VYTEAGRTASTDETCRSRPWKHPARRCGKLHAIVPARLRALAALILALPQVAATPAAGQELQRGIVIEAVTAADDAAQTYALYLPSDYTPDRAWNLLLAFHPAARGTAFVETYRAAAERYGYIVAASNNSRNGSWEVITRAVRAMSRDVGRRFAVDAQRVYLTGHSGGARVAMEVALGPNQIAGVIASSAGFPDAKPRKSVKFPVFATAGTDDFNYLELKRLDAALTTPHHLAVFEGGHVLPPVGVAREAIEWLEVQAMRDGRRGRDTALIDALFAARRARAMDEHDPAARLAALQSLARHFKGLCNVAAVEADAAALERDPETKKAIGRDRTALAAEARLLDDALAAEGRLTDAGGRATALAALRSMFEDWSQAAQAPEPSAARSQARRLLGAVSAGAAARVKDEEYRALVQQYRWRQPSA
jgi:poly(3-hydroxybutyrate) depolymerase